MKANLNSNLLPIINVGMYNSSISPENIFDNYIIDYDYKKGFIKFNSEYYWDNFENDKFTKDIETLASNYLNGTLRNDNGIEVIIKCGKIYSPRAYNYATDNIDIEVDYNKVKVCKFAKDNKKNFDKFLKDNYSSYDGFYSHTSNNYNDWLIDFKDNNVQSVGAVLSYIFKQNCIDNDYSFCEFVFENVSYSDYIDYTQINSEVETVENFVKDNYMTIDTLDVDWEQFNFEVLTIESVRNTMLETIATIENNTLTLNLI